MNTLDEIMRLSDHLECEAVYAAAGRNGLNGVHAAREALRTRLTALVADAERYQWLRNSNQQPQREVFLDCKTKPELDAAIDAARATQQTKESQ